MHKVNKRKRRRKNIEKNKKNILPYLGIEIEISVINLEIIRFWSNILMDL